jgi:hypothetical protein
MQFKWTKAALHSSAVFGFIRYPLRKWVCNFVFKILNQNKPHFWTLLWKKNTKQTKFCNVNKVAVCTLWKLWKWMTKSYMFLMMSWKRQVPREVPNVAKKIKITSSQRIGKIYEWMKTSERKTMNERQWAKNDERKRNLHPLVTMDTD